MTADLVAFLRARLDEDEATCRSYKIFGETPQPLPLHHPHRLLAEVRAKLAILDWATRWPLRPPRASDGIAAEDTLLQYLALPYQDHSDYRQEWRP